ncbi:MAG: hypothetical protein FJ319_01820 [SAR202 cluster bacterium]|nr:hypothetical protein [SAR202 cluster bacterium]
MYGTIFKMKVKKGHEQQVMDITKQWDEQRTPKAKGVIGEYVMKPDSGPANEYIVVVIFSDQAAYRALAADPEQDRWYRKLREHLETDPEWQDGEYIAASLPKQAAGAKGK